MGPRLFRRGNNVVSDEYQGKFSILQWGHAFSDVEIWAVTYTTA